MERLGPSLSNNVRELGCPTIELRGAAAFCRVPLKRIVMLGHSPLFHFLSNLNGNGLAAAVSGMFKVPF